MTHRRTSCVTEKLWGRWKSQMVKRAGGETSPPISPADVVCFMGADGGTDTHTHNTHTPHMYIHNGASCIVVRAEEYLPFFVFRNRRLSSLGDINRFLITAYSIRSLREFPFPSREKLPRAFFFHSLVESRLPQVPPSSLSNLTSCTPFCIRSQTPGSKCCRSCSRFSRNDAAYILHRRAGFSQQRRRWETIPRSLFRDIRSSPSPFSPFFFPFAHRAANRFYGILLGIADERIAKRVGRSYGRIYSR